MQRSKVTLFVVVVIACCNKLKQQNNIKHTLRVHIKARELASIRPPTQSQAYTLLYFHQSMSLSYSKEREERVKLTLHASQGFLHSCYEAFRRCASWSKCRYSNPESPQEAAAPL